MIKFTIFALALVHPAASRAQQPLDASTIAHTPRCETECQSENRAEIQHLIDLYHSAIHAHDGDRVASLFLPEAQWLNILANQPYAEDKAKALDAVKVRKGTYKDFAKFVSTTIKELNPISSNRTIQTDGTIASVYFDFVFFIDGEPQNRGAENWVLVREDDGWRIASVVYSSTPEH